MTPSWSAGTIQEYLATSYRPDLEYLDGRLCEKSTVEPVHGVILAILSDWFRNHLKEWGIKVAVDTRTQVEKERVRLPDLVVVAREEHATGALQVAPLIAIEILSPSDRYTDLKNHAADLRAMGTENIWLIDPELRTAEIWSGKAWVAAESSILSAINSRIHFDLSWLWAELDD